MPQCGQNTGPESAGVPSNPYPAPFAASAAPSRFRPVVPTAEAALPMSSVTQTVLPPQAVLSRKIAERVFFPVLPRHGTSAAANAARIAPPQSTAPPVPRFPPEESAPSYPADSKSTRPPPRSTFPNRFPPGRTIRSETEGGLRRFDRAFLLRRRQSNHRDFFHSETDSVPRLPSKNGAPVPMQSAPAAAAPMRRAPDGSVPESLHQHRFPSQCSSCAGRHRQCRKIADIPLEHILSTFVPPLISIFCHYTVADPVLQPPIDGNAVTRANREMLSQKFSSSSA